MFLLYEGRSVNPGLEQHQSKVTMCSSPAFSHPHQQLQKKKQIIETELLSAVKSYNTLWYGGIGSCANFVKFSMSPNGLFGISTLNLISGGPYGTINFYVMLHLGPI